ncbi:MAG: ATP-dependent RecD-like DNA helicase [Lachnospiraceae bacterium]|nr:ATP-dependent RecD-like DNA helicase [Lachnospiraceae bacterium]
MEIITGYIEHIIYRNDENGYTVLNLVSGGEDITCVGSFKYADEGENVEVTGEFTEHAVYGEQFKVSSYEVKSPEDALSMIRYLGSGAIKGVGQALADRIVKKFGDDTFRIMEEEPERLAEVRGISERKAREIAVQVGEKQEQRRVMMFLQQYGVSNALSVKIYNKYGDETFNVINENPYMLADDIRGVGFKIADEIAKKAGIRTDSDYRIRSALDHILNDASGEGHCYLPVDELLSRAERLLEVPVEVIRIQLENAVMEQRLCIKPVGDDKAVYKKPVYLMELGCARRLVDLDIVTEDDEEAIRDRIGVLEKNEKTELEDLQKEAVVNAVKNGLTIITGGPGTGKTTIINMIIRYFETEGMDIVLAAPTGRAAKRMSETTGYEASTIQRMLHLTVTDGETDMSDRNFYYEFNEDNPIEADVVIIDEMSMVDIMLFNALLKAIPVGVRLILVGDINQLPSVGPGAVLKDVILSECFPVVYLKKIFRQSEQSNIVVNAHKINEGVHPDLNVKNRDFFMLEADRSDVILKYIVQLISDKLPREFKVKPYDLQVLTPMRKGNLGVEALNPVLQRYLNPPSPSKKEYESGNAIFREGDKVMQIKNNYSLEWEITSKYGIGIDRGMGVFNGDTGMICEIDTLNETLTVEYDGMRRVTYPFGGLDELEHAYAVTIHKSQGSEYPAVIIPLLSGPRLLFNRNLLYTGVTRARDCVVLLGSMDQINSMIDNTDEYLRYTGLAEQIKAIAEAGD